MSSEDQIDDPFAKLLEALSVLENDSRAIALISVYVGQRTDSNTVASILDIYNKLKGEEATAGKLRGYLTAFVNSGLIDRETEKLMGSTKVGFHQITSLGIIGVLYLCLNVITNPSEIKWDLQSFNDTVTRDDSFFIQFLADNFISELKSPAKIIHMVTSGSNLSKLKINPQDLKIELNLSKDNTFKVFEELLFNFLQGSPAITKNQVEELLEGESATKYFNKLGQLIMEEKIGKFSYYSLSTKGLMLLPIIALFIRELVLDKTFMESIKPSKKFDSETDIWMSLVKNSLNSFRKLFKIEQFL